MISRVYRNLNTGLWSIQQRRDNKWVVVGHAHSCILQNVTVRQSEAARQQVLAKRCRSVHCWVTGELIVCSADSSYKGRRPQLGIGLVPNGDGYRGVTYNPYTDKTLVYRDDGSEYTGSEYAIFTRDQKMVVI